MKPADQLRQLAGVVERIETDLDVEVQDARLAGVSVDGELVRGDLTILAPAEQVADDTETEAADGDEATPETFECEVDGCEFASESERGLAIHTGRTHKEDGEDEEPVEATEDDDRVDEEEPESDPFLTAAGKRRDGHSIDDDETSLSEADVEPEAPHDDLEEQAADDGAEDNGDDVQDEDHDQGDVLTQADVLEAMREFRDRGKSYVSASQLATKLDVTSQKIGARLRRLHEAGQVDQFNPDSTSINSWTLVEEETVDQTGDDEAPVTFGRLETPDWLDEASFFQAADDADTIGELAHTLGWGDRERLEEMLDVLDVELDQSEEVVA